MYYLGIDPGKKGAFALLDDKKEIHQVWDMHLNKQREVTPEGIIAIYAEVKKFIDGEDIYVMIEKPYIGEKMRGRAIGTYFFEAGQLMSVAGFGWNYKLIQPSIWTKELHEGMPAKLSAKDKSLKVFTQLFKGMANSDIFVQGRTVYDGRIDAVLIAEYARREHNGIKLANRQRRESEQEQERQSV